MKHTEKLHRFAELVEKDQADLYARDYPALNPPKVAVLLGNKYAKVDVGDSGKYMVDKEGSIWGIKAYGVIHRGKAFGTLDTIHDYYWGGYAGVKK